MDHRADLGRRSGIGVRRKPTGEHPFARDDENPKSSALTGLNLLRCIKNRLNPVAE
ncbi:MAG: hypothetical protein KTU85_02975 [Acidimicrobiia bacterium]|nr:hypothetical protein [Acidimicrobiia bacterium]